MLKSNSAALGVLERKILNKIFGPVPIGNGFRIRTNKELNDPLNGMNVVQRIIILRLRWLCYVHRRVFNAEINWRRQEKKTLDGQDEGF